MKASSPLYSVVQKPITLFGLPVSYAAFTVCLTFVTAMFCLLANLMLLLVFAPILVFVTGVAMSLKAIRADHHVDTLMIARLKFWKTYAGHRYWKSVVTRRVLMTGGPEKHSITKGQKA